MDCSKIESGQIKNTISTDEGLKKVIIKNKK
jgi:hypothetical protein